MVLENSYSKWCARNMSFLMFMLHSHVQSPLIIEGCLFVRRLGGPGPEAMHALGVSLRRSPRDTGRGGAMKSYGKPRHNRKDAKD